MSDSRRQGSFFALVMEKIKLFFTKNWQYKLISVLASIVLWGALISNDNTLTREKSFTDVPVSITGSEYAIQNNGKIVISGLEDENLTVRMWADVPQSAYKTVTASVYNPRIDLSRITKSGEQSLSIQVSSSSINGTVTQIVPDTIQVVVDDYVTNYRVPVSLNQIGDYPENMGGGTPVADPSTVAVSGPASVVDRIARLRVDYDLSQLSGKSGFVRTALSFRFEDGSGEEVSSDLLKVTSANIVLRTITVAHSVYSTREIEIAAGKLVSGTPAQGYAVTGVEILPGTVTIGGSAEVIGAVNQVFLDGEISVEGLSESVTQAVKLTRPSDIVFISNDTVAVTVTIEPVISTKKFTDIRITGTGLASGLKASILPKKGTVELTGFVNTLNKMKSGQLSLSVDLSSLTEAGEYTLPVDISISDDDGQTLQASCDPGEVTVKLEEK